MYDHRYSRVWGQRSARLLFLPLMAFAISLPSNSQDTDAATNGNKTEKISSQQELLKAQVSANAPYLLGSGDVITIHFENRPEMSNRQTIGPDGYISLPVVGSLKVSDKSREQAASAIATALKPYYTSLVVTVSVDAYTSNKVLLLGAVERPGLQTFDTPPTLLEVLSRGGGMARSGGVAPTANRDQQPSLQTGAMPDRCTIYRGSDTVLWIDLKQMLTSGNALADMRLQRDDVVYVPSPAERTITVLGQVQHPGVVELNNSSTLATILAQAGGLGERAGKNPMLQIVQPSTGKTRQIAFNTVLQPAATDLTLHPGDVVYVPSSGFNNMAYVIEKLSPIASVFTTSALLMQR